MSVSLDTAGAIVFKGSSGTAINLSAAANSISVPASSGITHTGTVQNAPYACGNLTLAVVPAANRTLNSKCGKLLFTGVASIAGGATDTLTIVNSAAGSTGMVVLEVPTIAVDSNPFISSVVWTAGTSIAVTISNPSANATAANCAFNFCFYSFN